MFVVQAVISSAGIAVPNVGTAPALFTLLKTVVVFKVTSVVLLVAPVGIVTEWLAIVDLAANVPKVGLFWI